jgi:hypothetical protein
VLQILRVLGRKRITRELLKDTLIGKNITGLTKLVCPPSRKDLDGELQEIKERAQELIENWKNAAKTEKKQGGGQQARTDEAKKEDS